MMKDTNQEENPQKNADSSESKDLEADNPRDSTGGNSTVETGTEVGSTAVKPISTGDGNPFLNRMTRGVKPRTVTRKYIRPQPPYEDVIVLSQGNGKHNGMMSGTVPEPCCYKAKIGRLYVFRDKKLPNGKTEPTCVIGPCWPMVILVTLLVIGVPTVATTFAYISNEYAIYIIPVVIIFVIGTLVSYYMVACGHPGFQRVKKTLDDIPDNEHHLWFFDEQIQSYRTTAWNYDNETELMIEKNRSFLPLDRNYYCKTES